LFIEVVTRGLSDLSSDTARLKFREASAAVAVTAEAVLEEADEEEATGDGKSLFITEHDDMTSVTAAHIAAHTDILANLFTFRSPSSRHDCRCLITLYYHNRARAAIVRPGSEACKKAQNGLLRSAPKDARINKNEPS
jgi:hypothetical protein